MQKIYGRLFPNPFHSFLQTKKRCVCGQIDNDVMHIPHMHIVCYVQIYTNLTTKETPILEGGRFIIHLILRLPCSPTRWPHYKTPYNSRRKVVHFREAYEVYYNQMTLTHLLLMVIVGNLGFTHVINFSLHLKKYSTNYGVKYYNP
jgi:hypothetical protein